MTIFQKVITLAKPTREFGFTRSLVVQMNTVHTGRSDWLRLGCLFVFLLLNLPFLLLLIHLTVSTAIFNR